MANITIKEIAQMAGVSIGTVDRVLHNRTGVKKETKEKILKICEQEGYETNLLGKGMIFRKKNHKIAVVINAPEKNIFSSQIKEGLDAINYKWKDYNVTFDYYFMKSSDAAEQISYLETITSGKAEYEGLIIKPVNDKQILMLLQELQKDDFPVITCTSDLAGFQPLYFVGQNHLKQGRMAANMLLKCKPDVSQVAVLSIKKIIFSRAQRIEGFVQYLQEKDRNIHIHEVIELPDDEQGVYEQTLAFLQKNKNLQALYAHTRHLKSVNQAITETQRQDLIVFSFGMPEIMAEHLKEGRLTFAIDEQPYRHGYIAGREMLNYIWTRKAVPEKAIYMPSSIMIEESV